LHITIGLADPECERAFYSAVLAELGIMELPAESDDESFGYGLAGFELPGLRPNYSPNDYAAYVPDPVGNKLQAVCRRSNKVS